MDSGKRCEGRGLTFADWNEYWVDFAQRAVLFMDVLRVRGNNYLDTIKEGEPPVLVFDYEVILSGAELDRPVNYDLARIVARKTDVIDPKKRPIVVIDPRAGNGPGIGGSKKDSEIGDALAQGHSVYFILFHPDPLPGQTIPDVERAEIRFIEEVAKLHPDAAKPAVIGNCQAGWAVALLGADRPDLTGPLVLNGTPLSYWAGVKGKNPMRYAGGLLGGIWLSSLLADLGDGKFDGAWLEENFENLNPANTLWSKQYNLFANIDTEKERYLTFEKWWDGYSYMTGEEMHEIVKNLFVGDEFEQGRLSLDKKKLLNLKNIEKPIVIFASHGDNITPPQQALDWIIEEYRSVEEIRRLGKVIVYMLHPDVGHLGIFVGSKIARKEHNEIIKSIEVINSLPPGLYEMKIVEKGQVEGISDYDVVFEEREMEALLALNDTKAKMSEQKADFSRVAAVSDINDTVYTAFFSPWVKMFANPASAALMRELHPLRVSKYIFSDRLNPFMVPFRFLAPEVEKNRKPARADNPLVELQNLVSDSIVAGLETYQDIRDRVSENLFFSIYENPMMKLLFPSQKKNTAKPEQPQQCPRFEDFMDKGGLEEGLIRMILALEDADRAIDRDSLLHDEVLLGSSGAFANLKQEDFLRIAHDQGCMLKADEDQAIAALCVLIPDCEERRKAMELAARIVLRGAAPSAGQEVVLSKIARTLEKAQAAPVRAH
jgi:pimeloyl-ACP methyl ester carboxylesterase